MQLFFVMREIFYNYIVNNNERSSRNQRHRKLVSESYKMLRNTNIAYLFKCDHNIERA